MPTKMPMKSAVSIRMPDASRPGTHDGVDGLAGDRGVAEVALERRPSASAR